MSIICVKKITPHERRVLHDETSFISTPFIEKKIMFFSNFETIVLHLFPISKWVGEYNKHTHTHTSHF